MTMKTAKMLRSAAFLLALSPVAASAQPVAQTPSTASKAIVTLQQYVSRHEKKLLAADTDGDGKVSKAEFLAAAKPGKADPAKRFTKLDRNGDAMLDKTEIDAMLTRRFKKLDANGDGVASAEERAVAYATKGKAAGDGSAS